MNTVRFEFADNTEDIMNYLKDPWNEIDLCDYIVFRLPPTGGYEIYASDRSHYSHYDTFSELCEEFLGDECGM